ncbi:MAG: TDT family transporter [Candidatus Endonucleobacter bathymodioli]|uniref:TDT family transporter n=1 Tax=Candidatus Endonucleibacter bathymodioli TaxID=539814 RepID=A0AA90NXH4_9GAMM|nr:TDT family transporter [Candidatus Endonucleobacter bathymodioli]
MSTVQENYQPKHTILEKVKAKLELTPTAMGGLALGIASLGSAWAMVISQDWVEPVKITSAAIASILILVIALKLIVHFHLFKKELAHPIIGSIVPACAMSTMVVAQSLFKVMPEVAPMLWLSAIICHIILLVGFIANRIIDFELEHMVPSWFVPPVGIIVAAVTSHGMNFDGLVYWLFIFGIGCYAIVLPAMLYRLIFKALIPDTALPTFAIMAAPASLALAGYLSITSQPDPLLLLVLAPLGVFMTGLVYIGFIRLLRLPFSPAYASFTFPMVIGATALIKLTGWLLINNFVWLARVTDNLAWIELIIATGIVSYVTFRYVFHYLIEPLLSTSR